ncbi:MAG: N-6 DNA methylase [Candidatus Brocadiia bacterium]
MLKDYFRSLHEVASRGDATELSYYGSLSAFIEAFAADSGHDDIHVTALPAPTEGGNPDFRVWDGDHEITGYIEAKRPKQDRLDVVEDTEQLARYRDTFPNLILTNFFEFRLYRNGQMVERALAGQPGTLTRIGAVPPPQGVGETEDLLERFLSFSMPRTYDAPSLAVELAKRTRFLRDLVLDQLEAELEADSGMLLGFYRAFQTFLIGRLEPEQFADLYAQTVTYGLFAARTRAEDAFTRRSAYDNIPRTIGVLRDVFRFISLEDLPEEIEWTVDEIAQVLRVADVPRILGRYYEDGKGADPIVHFYEPFLAEYDPDERERRGVYYTPEPVVDYIVRSLHGILKEKFGKAEGLASGDVTLLDPAAGTMTFVARACRRAVEEFVENHGAGKRGEFIQKHILENFHAFELMMAPYAVGHLKMGFFLEELGHRLDEEERFKFYLTNTLEMEDLEQTELPGMKSLAEESRLAGQVKKKKPILVILGNPPYSGHSSNRGEWITGKIEDYKQVDGEPLGERNPKWLQDDYVKFLRFAQWKIDQAGQGVVGMITNHSWLDNPTFRGMRRSLMKSFDEIYVLDLHGNSLKRETCPDGSPDENVFDIRQGVAVSFFLKLPG